jgi:hypothetical protein
MAELPKYARTPSGLRGDALNVALIGEEEEVDHAFAAAGWAQAAALSLRADAGIAASVLLGRPDPTAPVSTLLVWGRKQDLAFEKEIGHSAKSRNHVRFWRSPLSPGGRRLWVGAATQDARVELAHNTAQVTHRISPDIDAERALVIGDLARTGQLTRVFSVTGIGPTLDGRNGGGDRYWTDGEIEVGTLATAAQAGHATAERLASPVPVQVKNTLWGWLGAAAQPAEDR